MFRAAAKQRAFLDADAPRKQRRVQNGKDDRDFYGTEGERQDCDLGADDDVVRMTEETIGAAPRERRSGYRDDARRPILNGCNKA